MCVQIPLCREALQSSLYWGFSKLSLWGPHESPPISVGKMPKCVFVCLHVCMKHLREVLVYRCFEKPPLYRELRTQIHTHIRTFHTFSRVTHSRPREIRGNSNNRQNENSVCFVPFIRIMIRNKFLSIRISFYFFSYLTLHRIERVTIHISTTL